MKKRGRRKNKKNIRSEKRLDRRGEERKYKEVRRRIGEKEGDEGRIFTSTGDRKSNSSLVL